MASTTQSNHFRILLAVENVVVSANLKDQRIVFKLAIKKLSNDVEVYVGKIKSLEECGEAKDMFENVSDLFFNLNSKTVKINLKQKILAFCFEEKKQSSLSIQNDQSNHEILCKLSLVSHPYLFEAPKQQWNEFPKIKSNNWVNKKGCYYDQMKFKENKIINPTKYSIAFGANILGDRFKITIRVNQMRHCNIGISDIENTYSLGWNDFGFSYSNKGMILEKGEERANLQPFKIGDQICMTGNISKAEVSFKVNQRFVGTYKFIQMYDRRIKWVPFISVSSISSISIVQSFPQIQLLPTYLAESWFMWDEDLLNGVNNLVGQFPEWDQSQCQSLLLPKL